MSIFISTFLALIVFLILATAMRSGYDKAAYIMLGLFCTGLDVFLICCFSLISRLFI